MSKVRVLMLGPGLNVKGGVAAVERVILESMPANISTTHVATMVDGSKFRKLATYAKAILSADAILRTGVDIVHIHFASRASSMRKELLARLAFARKAKVVMHAHGAEYRVYWTELTSSQRRKTLSVLTRVNALVVLGNTWRDFFLSIGVPADKVVVLPNPVVLPSAVPERKESGIVSFAYLGIIDKRKGAFDLVEAVQRLPDHVRARVRVTVAGNGEGPRLRSIVRERALGGIINVLDWVTSTERDEILARSDAFVLPSRNEGLPMALLEAMAWGLAPICTPVGSIPEIVYDGANGILVTPGDTAGLAAAIQRMTEDDTERRRMGSLARQAVEPLSVGSYVYKLSRLYQSIHRDDGPEVQR